MDSVFIIFEKLTLYDMTLPDGFIYNQEQLVTDKNSDLLKQIEDEYKIQIEFKHDDSSWMADLNEMVATIYYTQCKYPEEAFTHELLHIKYEHLGLKMPLTDDPDCKDIMPFLFNQLCHHKIYSEYESMRYNKKRFLSDNDAGYAKDAYKDVMRLKEGFKKNNVKYKMKGILLPFLFLISPNDDTRESKNYLNELRMICEPGLINKLKEIIKEWSISQDYDCSTTLAKLYKACGVTGISFGMNEDNLISTDDVSV